MASFYEDMPETTPLPLTDTFGRELRDLRISVTDRCNLRCVYCMPRQVFGKDFRFIPHPEMLSFEEIERLAKIAVSLGVTKIRLTGGEPLLRRGITELVKILSAIRQPDGSPVDLSLTTNGVVLENKAEELFEAGLNRVTVSLDAVDDALYRKITDTDVAAKDVLDGIFKAVSLGFDPVKVNCVVRRSLNEDQVVKLCETFRSTGVILRFIEYMDAGETNNWKNSEVVSEQEIVSMISERYPLEKLPRKNAPDTATRYAFEDGAGEIGIISSVSSPFCRDCSRMRLSTDGKFYTCLFATDGTDIKTPLRAGATDEKLGALIANVWKTRSDRYSLLRSEEKPVVFSRKIEMSYIGG